jgi:hypothetical protein
MVLPDKVKKMPDGEIVETRSLLKGDKFSVENRVWVVLAVKADGIECAQDPTYFQFKSLS